MASRLQTKPEISPNIGAKSKALTIQSQPYITLPYLSKKSGTSVDVKVDVNNMTEQNGTEGRRGPGYLPVNTQVSCLCKFHLIDETFRPARL